MDTYLEVVYSDEASQQLEALVDSDIRIQEDTQAYEWLISRDPENLGTPFVLGDKTVFVFITESSPEGLPPIVVTYLVQRDRHRILVIDIRLLP